MMNWLENMIVINLQLLLMKRVWIVSKEYVYRRPQKHNINSVLFYLSNIKLDTILIANEPYSSTLCNAKEMLWNIIIKKLKLLSIHFYF